MGLFNQLSNPSAPVERNAFDRSERVVFSSSVGNVQPVGCFETMPNAEYDIDIQQILRSDPIIGAPFTRLKMNYEFAYVDYSSMWSQFGDFIAQREDLQFANQGQHTAMPTFKLRQFAVGVLLCAAYEYFIETYVRGVVQTALQPNEIPYTIRRANCPWDSFFIGVLKNFDLLGYGNFIPVMHNFLKLLAKNNNAIDQVIADTSIPNVPSTWSDWRENKLHALYLLSESESVDALATIAISSLAPYFNTDDVEVHVNGWRPAAYTRYWYDFKRNDIYDQEIIVDDLGTSFLTYLSKLLSHNSLIPFNGGQFIGVISSNSLNVIIRYVDLFNYDTPMDDGIDMYYLLYAFSMKYVQYKKDIFSGVLPSTQFGDVAMMSENDVWHQLLYKSGNSDGFVDGVRVPIDNSGSYAGETDYPVFYPSNANITDSPMFRFDPATAISVIEQRSANALQRFRERMMRAGNKTKKNYKAHWGVEPSRILDTSAIFLGAYDGALELNMTPATSNNGDTQIGELGANGVGFVQGSHIHFKSNDFGLIMAFFYMEKPAEYDGFGVNRFNQLVDVWDFPYPEFMNISLAPVDSLTFNQFPIANVGGSDLRDRILGYLPRFIEHKTSVDRVTGEFFSSSPIGTYGTYNDNGTFETFDDIPIGVFAHKVTPRLGYGSSKDIDFLYVNPASVDNIFETAWNPMPSFDHFFINCNFDVKVVLPLSVVGLPV